MSGPAEKIETVEIIVPVRITYRKPEDRAAAIQSLCRDLGRVDSSCVGSVSYRAKGVGPGRELTA